jgi:MFS family permease
VSRRAVFVSVWVPYPFLWCALILLPPLEVAMTILFLIGMAAGAFAPFEQLFRQERTPRELRGRVFSTYLASLTLVIPPATLIAGLAVDVFGLRATIAAFAAGNLVLSILALAEGTRRLGGDERRLTPAEGG